MYMSKNAVQLCFQAAFRIIFEITYYLNRVPNNIDMWWYSEHFDDVRLYI